MSQNSSSIGSRCSLRPDSLPVLFSVCQVVLHITVVETFSMTLLSSSHVATHSTRLRLVSSLSLRSSLRAQCRRRLLFPAAVTLAAALTVPPATTCIVSDCNIVIIWLLAL